MFHLKPLIIIKIIIIIIIILIFSYIIRITCIFNMTVSLVKVGKDLGVIFDEKLLFREHISKKIAIANRNLGLILKSFNYLNKEMFMCLYKALVRPHLEYATQVWAPMYKKDPVTLI